MAGKPYTPPRETDVTVFVTADHYIVGAGETMEEVSARGEWVMTQDPVDVRR